MTTKILDLDIIFREIECLQLVIKRLFFEFAFNATTC